MRPTRSHRHAVWRAALAIAAVLALYCSAALAANTPVAVVPRAQALRTAAYIGLLTPAPTVGVPVRFSLYGSAVKSGSRLRSAQISFGDGIVSRARSLSSSPAHVYRRAGGYTVVLQIIDSRGHRATARRTFVISGRNRVVIRRGTPVIPAADLRALIPTSLTGQTLTLSPGAPVPAVGHAFIVRPGPLDPNGLVAIAVTVTHNPNGTTNIESKDGSLSSAYSSVSLAATSSIGAHTLAITRLTTNGTRVVLSANAAHAVPFTCTTSAGQSISVTADLSKTYLGVVVNLSAKTFQFDLISRPVFTLGVTFTGSASCSLAGGFGLNFPVPAVPGLVISAAPYFDLNATGTIEADVTWHPAVALDVLRSPWRNTSYVDFSSSVGASASGNASVKLDGGLTVGVSVGRAVGIEASSGPSVTASASLTTAQSCVDVSSEIDLAVKLYAGVFFVSKDWTLYHGVYDWTPLFHRCVAGGSGAGGQGGVAPTTPIPHPVGGGSGGGSSGGGASYVGPSVAETSGGVSRTWTDYVHAGGTEGPSIAAGQTVGIVCKLIGFQVADGNTWWYQIASSPWNAGFYVSADAFYNNGQISGSLHGTPFVDPSVPTCASSAGAPPTATTPPTTPSTPTSGGTYAETTGGVTHTWTNYLNAGGTQGASISSNTTVQITCKLTGFAVADGNTWWYQIASSPWSNAYYASADAFYNNGQTSGSLNGTPFVDPSVPTCGSSSPPPPAPTWSETAGGVAHTWTNYLNAGGTQGPSIASNQTVQIACKITGFRVADGNTWWYRIASSPWSNSYYVSADAFYNNGQTSGSLTGTPFVDPAVASC